MDPLLIPLMGILLGFFAIGAGTYAKVQKEKNQALGSQIDPAVLQAVKELPQLRAENRKLKERLQNVEYIVTSMDKEILQLHASRKENREENPEEDIARLKRRLEDGSNS